MGCEKSLNYESINLEFSWQLAKGTFMSRQGKKFFEKAATETRGVRFSSESFGVVCQAFSELRHVSTRLQLFWSEYSRTNFRVS